MGSGKSTLVEALAGEQMLQSGSMEVSERVVMVDNAPWLKGGTIRENILFGAACSQSAYDKVGISKICTVSRQLSIVPIIMCVNKFAELNSCDACLPQVVKACGLTEDFRRLPQGDQTWVQGCGENLSGGQRQRISLARAVYRGCPVYVLDDPLSAVDPKLRHAIFKVRGGEGGINVVGMQPAYFSILYRVIV